MSEGTTDPINGPSRRLLLKGAVAGAGALWLAPAIESYVSPAAAVSGTATQSLQKDPNGTLAARCGTGCDSNQCSNAGRGSVTFVRTAGATPTISATITLSSGPDITGRSIYILQGNGSPTGTCIAQSLAPTVWAATPLNGPQTFTVPVASGATWFAVMIPQSGGGGTDIYTSYQVNLP
jgi:hypothetical protein